MEIYVVKSKIEDSNKGFFVLIDDTDDVAAQMEDMDISEDEYIYYRIKREELFVMVNDMSIMLESGIEIVKKLLKIR